LIAPGLESRFEVLSSDLGFTSPPAQASVKSLAWSPGDGKLDTINAAERRSWIYDIEWRNQCHPLVCPRLGRVADWKAEACKSPKKKSNVNNRFLIKLPKLHANCIEIYKTQRFEINSRPAVILVMVCALCRSFVCLL